MTAEMAQSSCRSVSVDHGDSMPSRDRLKSCTFIKFQWALYVVNSHHTSCTAVSVHKSNNELSMRFFLRNYFLSTINGTCFQKAPVKALKDSTSIAILSTHTYTCKIYWLVGRIQCLSEHKSLSYPHNPIYTSRTHHLCPHRIQREDTCQVTTPWS